MASTYAARQVTLEKDVAGWRERERRRKLNGIALDCILDGPHYRRMERVAAWNALMRRKYEDAASRPWLPIAPDPPEPE